MLQIYRYALININLQINCNCYENCKLNELKVLLPALRVITQFAYYVNCST